MLINIFNFLKMYLILIQVKDIESRPEAPWIKKQNNIVLFSDEIEDIDIHLSKDCSGKYYY